MIRIVSVMMAVLMMITIHHTLQKEKTKIKRPSSTMKQATSNFPLRQRKQGKIAAFSRQLNVKTDKFNKF